MVERKLPTRKQLKANLQTVDTLLGIDQTDYRPISKDELTLRIEARIFEQDTVIYPERESANRLTPEWRRYKQKRDAKRNDGLNKT